MVKVTTQFKFNSMISNTTIFNQPLFYLGSLFKKNLLKSDDNQSYFDKISLIDDKSKDIYLEIETYNRHNKNKINYFLDRLNYNDEIAFMFDCAKLNLKTEKICDKTAVTINREDFAIFSTFSITCEEEDFAKFEDFIDASIKYFNKFYDECRLGKDEIKLWLSSDEGGYFTSLGYRKKRNLDTIYLPSKTKQKMIDDLTYFLDEKTKIKYGKLGILHKRTYLLEGIPGAGKSSFIMALASHFGYNLAIISFTPKMNDNDLIRLLRSLEEKEENKVFIIFEDMDCIFKERKSNDENRNMVTFSGILNALDGITTRDNMICFITTNYKQNLDSALIRPGRVDSIIRFDYVVKEQVIDIFTAFTERADKAQMFYDELCRFNINISTSLLQQYLLKYLDETNIDKVIDNLDELKKMYDAAHISKEVGETGLYN
jgi:predicted AAA+ superfamily ATPase